MFLACTNGYDAVSTASTVNMTLPNPDGVSAAQGFSAIASASASVDTWRVAAAIDLTDYRRDNYVWTLGENGGFSAATTISSSANLNDAVTITGGTGVYSLQYVMSLDGLLGSNSPLVASTFCASVFIPGGTGGGGWFCLNAGDTTPATFTLTYADLPFGVQITPNLSIAAQIFVEPLFPDEVEALGASTFSASGFSNFGSTVHLTSLRVTDASGQAIPGITLTSANGYNYPLSPENMVPVPEPHSLLLLVSGLACLAARRRLAGAD